ncbi:DNA glycosylase [Xylaria sp. FL1777]|nr:DNA glycosylase [Xylaria sp. FL1777]
MDFSRRTDKSPTADRQASELTNDFMFGFDVEDDDDRAYLAEVAMHRMGHEDDIKHFLRLGLLRGVEEWDQAICCASAMKDRGFSRNSLDGQDVLAFLSKLYGVDEPCRVLSPPQRLGRPCVKRKSKQACVSLDTQIVVPTKKQRRGKNGRDSPYWDEMRVPVRQQDDYCGRGLKGEGMAQKATRRKGSLEGAIPPTSTTPGEQSGGAIVTRACKGPASLDVQRGSTGGVTFVDSLGLMSPGEDIDNDGDDDTREKALPKLDIPMIRVLDTPDPNIRSIRTSSGHEQKEPPKAHQAPDDPGKPPASPQNQTQKRKAKSPYFTSANLPPPPSKSPKKRPPRGTVSSLPFPRLDAPRFGLIQEELAADPFRLLVAVTFLVRTTGKAAIPTFRALMARYPTPAALADADVADVVARIRHLGLGRVRAATIQRFARLWVVEPPRCGVRFAVRNYQCAESREEDEGGGGGGGGGREEEEEEGEEVLDAKTTTTSAWEIGHMTQGPYALDSWRIFCRDVLRGEAEDWNGGGREGEFQPEWMRVLPGDKELRACLRWMWMREGWLWDPATGEKVVLPDELRRAVQEGRVAYDEDTGDLRILDE